MEYDLANANIDFLLKSVDNIHKTLYNNYVIQKRIAYGV